MFSPRLREYLDVKGVMDVTQLHPSFANVDILRAMVEKVRHQEYPAGHDLRALRRVFDLNKVEPRSRYLHGIYPLSKDCWFIPCFLQEQADMWGKIDCFELDMSFKRISTPGFKEIHFGRWLKHQRMSK